MAMGGSQRYRNEMINSRLDALFVGRPVSFRSDGASSSIGSRRPMDSPVWLSFLGFDGDQVGDPAVHGGPDKAVHFYPAEHYSVWRAHFEMNGWDAASLARTSRRIWREFIRHRIDREQCANWRPVPHRHGLGGNQPRAATVLENRPSFRVARNDGGSDLYRTLRFLLPCIGGRLSVCW